MAKSIRMRARAKGDNISVKALITHPMETGRRRDKETDKVIPAHFIQRVVSEYKGEVVFEAYWGTGVSKNPFVSFEFKGGKAGDTVKLTWFDNTDQSSTAATTIK